MINITIFIASLITNLASAVFYKPAKINSQFSLEKQKNKTEYVTKSKDIPVLGITAFNNKSFFRNII